MEQFYHILGWALMVIVIALFFVLAYFTNILRDSVADAEIEDAWKKSKKYDPKIPLDQVPRPFSLSRTQLAVWTVVIACTYIYMGLICGTTTIEINSTILILMGISTGSTTFASIIDTAQASHDRHQEAVSEGFFRDILSDPNGISIHRFQNVVWTLVCIAIYFYVFSHSDCSKLPELDPTLIALTGISSATYLTLKVGENKPPVVANNGGSGGGTGGGGN